MLNLPIELNQKYTDLAYKMGVSKTAAIIFAMNWYIDYKDTMTILPDTIGAIKELDVKKVKD